MKPKFKPTFRITVLAVTALILGGATLPLYAQTEQQDSKVQEQSNGGKLLVTQFIPLTGGMQGHELVVLAEFTPFEVDLNASAPLTNISMIDLSELGFGDEKRNETDGGNETQVAVKSNTSMQQGLGSVVAKLPCDDDGNPEVSVLVSATPSIISIGVTPNYAALDMGDAVEAGTLGDVAVPLSDFGTSCLYHANLPAEVTNVSILNTENRELSFEDGGMYYVTMTAQVTPSDIS